MPIPDLNEYGFLPEGLHEASLEEVEDRFGGDTDTRRKLFEGLGGLVDLARHVGAERLFVGGSFVTAKPGPEDVDIVIRLGSQFLDQVDTGDAKALERVSRLRTRVPNEAFAAFDDRRWNMWIEFFCQVRCRRDRAIA